MKRLIVLLSALALVGFAPVAFAAITLDATTTSAEVNSGTTIHITLTVGAGCANPIIMFGEDYALINNPITAVTFNGSNSVFVASTSELTGNITAYQAYFLPVAGTTYSITSTNPAYSATGGGQAGAASFCGVNQTTPLDATSTGTGTVSPASTSITTVSNNDWVFGNWLENSNNAPTFPASESSTWNVNMASSPAQGVGAYRPNVSPAGHSGISATFTNTQWAMVVSALKPAGVAVATPDALFFAGD
jgi:hypothetical protein